MTIQDQRMAIAAGSSSRQGVVAICWIAMGLYMLMVVLATYMGVKLAKAHKREDRVKGAAALDMA
jgi:hypothetical protein